MTRINVVPVEVLSDKHLIAEYKEITRPFKKVVNAVEKGKTINDFNIPDKYVLGKGHEIFFFNKLTFLKDRYRDLYKELYKRGVNLDVEKYKKQLSYMHDHLHLHDFFNDYTPTKEAIYLNMTRLVIRSKNDDCYNEINRAIENNEF